MSTNAEPLSPSAIASLILSDSLPEARLAILQHRTQQEAAICALDVQHDLALRLTRDPITAAVDYRKARNVVRRTLSGAPSTLPEVGYEVTAPLPPEVQAVLDAAAAAVRSRTTLSVTGAFETLEDAVAAYLASITPTPPEPFTARIDRHVRTDRWSINASFSGAGVETWECLVIPDRRLKP